MPAAPIPTFRPVSMAITVVPFSWRFMPVLPSRVSAPAVVSISVATEDSMTLAALFLIVPDSA